MAPTSAQQQQYHQQAAVPQAMRQETAAVLSTAHRAAAWMCPAQQMCTSCSPQHRGTLKGSRCQRTCLQLLLLLRPQTSTSLCQVPTQRRRTLNSSDSSRQGTASAQQALTHSLKTRGRCCGRQPSCSSGCEARSRGWRLERALLLAVHQQPQGQHQRLRLQLWSRVASAAASSQLLLRRQIGQAHSEPLAAVV